MYISLYLLLSSVAIGPQEGEICCVFDFLAKRDVKRVDRFSCGLMILRRAKGLQCRTCHHLHYINGLPLLFEQYVLFLLLQVRFKITYWIVESSCNRVFELFCSYPRLQYSFQKQGPTSVPATTYVLFQPFQVLCRRRMAWPAAVVDVHLKIHLRRYFDVHDGTFPSLTALPERPIYFQTQIRFI